jgi:hypothetical protein
MGKLPGIHGIQAAALGFIADGVISQNGLTTSSTALPETLSITSSIASKTRKVEASGGYSS